MNAQERADSIIKDILDNHLPRIVEGLKLGYVDENQVLVVYDHAVRARILKEFAEAQPLLEHVDNLAKLNRELEAEWRAEAQQNKTNRELVAAAEHIERTQGKTVGDIPPMINVPTPGIPCGVLTQRENVRAVVVGENQFVSRFDESGGVISYDYSPNPEDALVTNHTVATRIANTLNTARGRQHPIQWRVEVTHKPVTPAVPRKLKDEIEAGLAFVQGRSTVNEIQVCYVLEVGDRPSTSSMTQERGRAKLLPVEVAKQLAKDLTTAYADMTFTAEAVADQGWKPTKDKLQCACGGLVKEHPTSVDMLFKCERCQRVYTDEQDVFNVRQTESITPQKCADATYWTTGTLAGGTTPVPMETEINLNGRKTTIQAVNGKFVLTYEQIIRMALNQRRGHLNAFTGSDAELPHETVVYHHRVPFAQLTGERDGSLWKGKSVECTPGMVIDSCNTGNA